MCDFVPHQSLPCVRGGRQANACSEGLSIPQSASLTAPLCKGSLGRCKRRRAADCRPYNITHRTSAKILPVKFLTGRINLFYGHPPNGRASVLWRTILPERIFAASASSPTPFPEMHSHPKSIKDPFDYHYTVGNDKCNHANS